MCVDVMCVCVCQLEEKRQKAIECRDAFREFKRQVAKNAEYSRTGKPIPPKVLQVSS